MTTPAVQVERRVGQRFPYLLPVSVRHAASSAEGLGFTQDLSSRGVFFFTEMQLPEGAEVELTLCMPAEITLAESMPVRCRGHVLRVIRPLVSAPDDSAARAESKTGGSKIGVAVRLEAYEYLDTSTDSSPAFERVSTLHPGRPEDRPSGQISARPFAN
jgi:PilZ domain